MSDIVKIINEADCVGDSLGKHNYNFLSLDQNICNLSSKFFNIDTNYNSAFLDLSANINNFNTFADMFEYPFDINKSTTATTYLSTYWQKREISLTFPVNIYDGDDNTRYYLDDKTPLTTLESWGLNQLQRNYPEINLNPSAVANVYFLLYSNIGTKHLEEKTSFGFASNTKPIVTRFKQDSTYTVPAGVDLIDVLIVGGGGGGGGQFSRGGGGGGGGGGILYLRGLSVSEYQNYTIKVGKGGNGGSPNNPGADGGNSSFGTNIAYGGKGGQSSTTTNAQGGVPGAGNATGYGGRGQGDSTTYRGVTDISPGLDGGMGYLFNELNEFFGGGGGAGNYSNTPNVGGFGGGGDGGHSSYIIINNVPIYSTVAPSLAQEGTANTGGGGGGAAYSQGNGANGGSGVVIVLQKFSAGALQTNKLFDVNQTKDDIYIKSIKIARYKINTLKRWTFDKFIA
jgi:hypothetical protein